MRWTKKQLIFMLKEKINELGRVPTTKELNEDKSIPSVSAFTRGITGKREGRYINMINSLGYKHNIRPFYHNVKHRMTPKEKKRFVEQIKTRTDKFIKDHGRLPYAYESYQTYGISSNSFIRIATGKRKYTSIGKAYQKLGYDVSGLKQRQKSFKRHKETDLDEVTKKQILNILDTGSYTKNITQSKKMPSVQLILKKYKSIDNFLISKLEISKVDHEIIKAFAKHFNIKYSKAYKLAV